MTIQWAEDAVRQLTAAHAYVAADNPRAAGRLLLQITQAVKQLSSHPRAGREGRVKNTRELVIVNTPYIVAYRIKDESTIQVLAVLHGKRRWPESF
jgi:addiction module RelE/StbE family toxin